MSTLLQARPMENLSQSRRPATLVDWITYPDRLSVEQAAFLLGRPARSMNGFTQPPWTHGTAPTAPH